MGLLLLRQKALTSAWDLFCRTFQGKRIPDPVVLMEAQGTEAMHDFQKGQTFWPIGATRVQTRRYGRQKGLEDTQLAGGVWPGGMRAPLARMVQHDHPVDSAWTDTSTGWTGPPYAPEEPTYPSTHTPHPNSVSSLLA